MAVRLPSQLWLNLMGLILSEQAQDPILTPKLGRKLFGGHQL